VQNVPDNHSSSNVIIFTGLYQLCHWTKHCYVFRIVINYTQRHYYCTDSQSTTFLSLKILRNKPFLFKTIVRFDLTCGNIINSMQDYLFIFLSVPNSDRDFIRFILCQQFPQPLNCLLFLPFTNKCLSLYVTLERPILKEPLATFWYTPNVGLCDTLRLKTFWIYSECIGESSVSDSDTVLNRGTEPILVSVWVWF